MAAGQRLPPIIGQGVDKNLLDRFLALVLGIKKAATAGLSQILPIGAPITRPNKLGRIHKRFDQHRAIPINIHPVVSDLFGGKR